MKTYNPTKTVQDVQHVVILMQENRSFDHYFGAMRGSGASVTGFRSRSKVVSVRLCSRTGSASIRLTVRINRRTRMFQDKRDTVTGNIRPWGMGPRVPMYVISPWSKGGWVNSEVADHTSVGQSFENGYFQSFSGSCTAEEPEVKVSFDYRKGFSMAMDI